MRVQPAAAIRPFAAVVAAAVVALFPHPSVAQDAPPPPVNVEPVTEGAVKTGQTFVGSVMPVRRATIGSAVDGRVVRFDVNEGDRIEQGGELAQLLTETISLELEAAEAELDLRKAELEELESGTRPEELAQAKAQLEAAKATKEYADSSLDRVSRLFRQGSATSEAFESARSAALSAAETYNERKAAHELAVAGPRIEQIKQAKARVAVQKAVAEKLRDQIKKHTIISRFDGYVVTEHTEEGQWVNRGDPVAEVVALDEVDVMAQVLESHVPHVRRGEAVRVEVPALPEEVFLGTVVLVVPQADLRARTFPVKIRVENRIEEGEPLLKAGMLARVALPTGPERQALLVPKDSIVLGGRTPLVYVVDRDSESAKTGTVRPVPVTLGVASESRIQVEGELQPNDLVVTRGNERLRPQQAVTIVPTRDSEVESTTAAE